MTNLRLLTISNAQIADLSLHAFATVLGTRLHIEFPKKIIQQYETDTDLDHLILLWIKEARTFGVVNQADVDLFVRCKLIFGGDFPHSQKTQWAAEILRRKDLDGEGKMDLLSEYMLFGLEQPF